MKLISPKYIYYGLDSTQKINNIVEEIKANKVYILCDPILKEINAIEKIASILKERNIKYEISTNVMAEPTVEKGNEIIEEVRNVQPGFDYSQVVVALWI